jgi:hypothetical protein
MSEYFKKLTPIFILFGFLGWFVVGWEISRILEKPKIVEIEKTKIEVIDYEDPRLFEEAVKQASQKYGIKEEVFYAIKECEGGHLWAWNRTQDGGYFQINWKTAKQYGAKDLSDLIDPRKAADLAGKIIQKEGLEPWVTKKCIVQKLIME